MKTEKFEYPFNLIQFDKGSQSKKTKTVPTAQKRKKGIQATVIEDDTAVGIPDPRDYKFTFRNMGNQLIEYMDENNLDTISHSSGVEGGRGDVSELVRVATGRGGEFSTEAFFLQSLFNEIIGFEDMIQQNVVEVEAENPLPTVFGRGMKMKELLPFGKYALNPAHLHKQKLGLKTRKNNAVKKYPIQNVSEDVAHILQSIGKQKAFDVSVLDDDDESFLYELIDYAEVPVHLPRQKGAGTRGDTDCKDKDLHRFELLKGQVLAGNNAKEIVDELKVLIVILMNDDRINRKQGQKLLTDLVSLGY